MFGIYLFFFFCVPIAGCLFYLFVCLVLFRFVLLLFVVVLEGGLGFFVFVFGFLQLFGVFGFVC